MIATPAAPAAKKKRNTVARWITISSITLTLAAGAGYFVLFHLGALPPECPPLSAELRTSSIEIDGEKRKFVYFAPSHLRPRPSLLILYHGGGGSPEQMRIHTAFEFDVLGEQHGFIVVYPEGYEGYWNTCQRSRKNAATVKNVDDIAFTQKLVDWFDHQYGIDRSHVFAAGFSNGAHMCYRLTLETPGTFAAVAAISANLPAEADSKCAGGSRVAPTMIINGTDDPINPYAGGELSFYGILNFGPVLSTHDTIAFFLAQHRIPDARTIRYSDANGNPETWVEENSWSDGSLPQRIVLVTVHGGGHSIPQNKYHFPKAFGTTNTDFDAPSAIWRFFERHGQKSRIEIIN